MKSILPYLKPYFFPAYRTGFSRQRSLLTICRLLFTTTFPLWCSYASARAQSKAGELRIAAAADLEPVLPTLVAAYQQRSGTHVTITYGSSATLTQQIQNGAPEDLFLSADCAHPQHLVQSNLAGEPKPIQYATGILALWARKDSPAQPLSLQGLQSPNVQRIAVANDLHAPYGAAATAELRALGLTQALAPKLVTGENIMQTAQFAETGNAQAALISLTIASSPHYRETGSYLVLPRKYPPITQCGVTVRSSHNLSAAHDFLRWLTAPKVQTRLPQFGLDPAR